jgi:DNA-binding NtrC family response regulator
MNEQNKILIVDDETIIQSALKRYLERKLSFQCDAAGTVQEGLHIFRENSHSLALLDISLPDGNGLDLLTTFKSLNPYIPVIIITGYADSTTEKRARHSGAEEFLEKPFSLDTLSDLIVKILSQKNPG